MRTDSSALKDKEMSYSVEAQGFHYNAANFSRVLPGQYGSDADQHLTLHLNYLSCTLTLQS